MKSIGPFNPPSGEVTVEIPDGVTITYGDEACNSLMNSTFAHGGPDGCGYGAFPDKAPLSVSPFENRQRFRVR